MKLTVTCHTHIALESDYESNAGDRSLKLISCVLQPLDEDALASLMKGVEEHKAAAESVFSEGAQDMSQRRARVRAGGPARRRAAGREQDSSEGEEVRAGSARLQPISRMLI